MATAPVVEPDEFLYPTTDNRPMAETDLHRKLMNDLIARLAARYAADPAVYVSGNLLVYYEQGNPYRVLAPDCFVVFGTDQQDRDIYKTWVDGPLPNVVFEITSKSTETEDRATKFRTYQDRWMVKEYFLFDPREEYLSPPLLGYRLDRGKLKPMKGVKGVLTSKVLGVTLARDGNWLRLRDAATGKPVLLPEEAEAAKARRAAKKAEAEAARLRAELAALKNPPTA